MTMNTPAWQQQYTAPTTTLNTTTAKDGVLIVDSTNHDLVVMDGITAGGHRLAKAATKIKAGTSNVKINDTTEGTLGGEITIKVLPGTIPGAVTVVTDPAGQPAGKYLDFEYTKADGTPGHYYVNMADFVNIYTAGSGITIVDGKIAVDRPTLVPLLITPDGGLIVDANNQLAVDFSKVLPQAPDNPDAPGTPVQPGTGNITEGDAIISTPDGKLAIDLGKVVDTGPDSLLQVVDGKITLKGVVSTDAGNNLKAGSDGLAYYPADLGTL